MCQQGSHYCCVAVAIVLIHIYQQHALVLYVQEAEPAAAPSNSVGQTTSAAPSNNQLPDSMPGGTPAASSAATAAATVPSASAPASKRGMPKGTVNMVNHVIIHKRYWMSIDKAPYTLPRNVTVS